MALIKDPAAARDEVAEDVARLSEGLSMAAAEATRGSSREGAPSAAALRGSTRDGARRGVSVADLAPAEIGDREPRRLDGPDRSIPVEEAERASEAARPAECWPSRSSEDPGPGRVCAAAPGEGAGGLEGSDAREALPERAQTDWAEEKRDPWVPEDHVRCAGASDPAASFASDRRADRGALGRASEAGDSLASQHLLEEWWLALRALAERWLHALDGSTLEARP